MLQIKITDKLIDIIKQERIKKNLSARELSTLLGKSQSYISTLERGKIDYIKSDIFIDIFKTILNCSDEEFQKYMNTLLSNITYKSGNKNSPEQEWIMQFDYVLRKIPINEDIIDDINTKLLKINKDSKDLLRKINQNQYLEDKDKYKDNEFKVIAADDKISIGACKFNMKQDFIDSVLNKEIKTINYINMRGIVYNLFLLEGFKDSEASNLTDAYLREHKFYTLEELVEARKKAQIQDFQNKKEDFYSLENLPDYEIEFEKHLQKIIGHFKFVRDLNISYALSSIKELDHNFDFDPKFMLALFKMPFYKLDKFSFKEKQNFLIKIVKLLLIEVKSHKDKNSNNKDSANKEIDNSTPPVWEHPPTVLILPYLEINLSGFSYVITS